MPLLQVLNNTKTRQTLEADGQSVVLSPGLNLVDKAFFQRAMELPENRLLLEMRMPPEDSEEPRNAS
jgi:hypothetical protein